MVWHVPIIHLLVKTTRTRTQGTGHTDSTANPKAMNTEDRKVGRWFYERRRERRLLRFPSPKSLFYYLSRLHGIQGTGHTVHYKA